MTVIIVYFGKGKKNDCSWNNQDRILLLTLRAVFVQIELFVQIDLFMQIDFDVNKIQV